MGMAVAIPGNIVSLKEFESALGREAVEKFRENSSTDLVHVALRSQTASDLGFIAAKELLRINNIDKDNIGFVVFISRTPDYRSPATATVLHYRLALPQDCIAFDINQGGTGFFHGLQIGCSLLQSVNKGYGIIILGDTPSKELSPSDPANLILGDCASAIILEKVPGSGEICVQTGTCSEKFRSFYISGGGFRKMNMKKEVPERNNDFPVTQDNLYIDWAEFLSFANGEMEDHINGFLEECNRSLVDYNLIVNSGFYNMETEILRMNTLENKTATQNIVSNTINYSGSTVPYYLINSIINKPDSDFHVFGTGYGEGLSWGLADFHIASRNLIPLIKSDKIFEEGFVSHDF